MKKKYIVLIALILAIPTTLCAATTPWTAPDQEAAKERAKEIVPFVADYLDEGKIQRRNRLLQAGISLDDVAEHYFLLDSPIIKKREDHFGPVRFAHKRHAALVNDCSECHHYRPKDANMAETTRCSACHQDAFNSDHPERLGLKAAFHQQCMECHKTEAKGPVTCTGCHLKNVPDHKELVKLPKNPSPFEVTKACLECHDDAANDMIKTAHWLWKGPSPYTAGHRKDIQHGKGTTALNNY